MVNNDKSQNTNVTAGTKSESNIYLKKSELEQAVTSLKKDIGYLIENDLGVWLKKNSYLTKSEISSLINKSNITLMTNITKSYDNDDVERLDNEINGPGGIRSEIVEIKDHLGTIDGSYISSDKESTFATNSQIEVLSDRITEISNEISGIDIDTSNFATKDEIPTKVSELENDKGYLTEHQSLTRYAKKTDLNGYATESWVEEQGYVKELPDLSNYVQKSDFNESVSSVVSNKLSSYAKKTDLNGYATESWVEEQGYVKELPDLSNYVQKSDLNGYVSSTSLSNKLSSYAKKTDFTGYATESWVEEQGYVKELPDLSNYVQKSNLNESISNKLSGYAKKTDLTGYATESWVESQGYIKELPDLSGYVQKSDLNESVSSVVSNKLSSYVKTNDVYTKNQIDANFLSKTDAADTYLSKTDAADKYITIKDVNKDFLKIEDYTGLKDATIISDYYKNSDIETLRHDLETSYLKNGFYIVAGNDIVIIKDNEISTLFDEGTLQPQIVWQEE